VRRGRIRILACRCLIAVLAALAGRSAAAADELVKFASAAPRTQVAQARGGGRKSAIPDDLRFKVAAAFYPPCENQAGARLTIPTAILIGASDEVTPAADCEKLAKAQPAGGADLKLMVYPGAAHLFDDPSFAEAKSLLGMRLKYDPSAAERSWSDLREFLAGKLAR
jgi:dienelactone hydrolase